MAQDGKGGEALLPERVATGFADLDGLLFGGLPERYAVIMTSPSSDERESLIKKFIEAGAKSHQTTFYLTSETSCSKSLAEEYPSNFYLLLCNSRVDTMIQDLPNVAKLKGVDNLTDIDIALTKYFRTLDPSRAGPKRACIDILSEVLMQHHAVITRKWLSSLLSDLRTKDFTTLAIINPKMHPQEEVQAILGLFEGEIQIYEKETEKGVEKFLRIRKLYNQRYLETELTLTEERPKTEAFCLADFAKFMRTKGYTVDHCSGLMKMGQAVICINQDGSVDGPEPFRTRAEKWVSQYRQA